MSSRRSEPPPLRPSVLDRLIDDAPGVGDATPDRAESLRAHKRALLRDLDWLLNTRQIAEPADDMFPEVQRSLYHYGLPDITSLSGDSKTVRRRLLRNVEECIRLFEPRLTGVRVSFAEAAADARGVHFVIEGMLQMEPEPQRIAFDTVLETASGEFHVGDDAHA